MVDLLDQFESVGLRQDGARRRPQQQLNPFDEPDVWSLPSVHVSCQCLQLIIGCRLPSMSYGWCLSIVSPAGYLLMLFLSFLFQRRSVRQYKSVEYPIFKRQDAPFSFGQGITHMVASSGCISLVHPGNIIYRFSLDNPRAAERK